MLDLSTLNPQQYKAVTTTDGPLLVLAGAGSGKTKVLTYRIAYILDTGLAMPNNILAMTFTNKAAGEMKERIEKLVSNTEFSSKSLWIGTFHSICVKLLKIYGDKIGIAPNFTIYDSSDQSSAVNEAMKRLNISEKDFNTKAIKNYISSAKNELITPVDYESFATGYFQETVAEVYPVYQKILSENNALDFDDLIMKTITLLKESPETLAKLADQFRYILVDEYQDTNHAQYMLVTMLASKHKNICCVGDDDQSIYAFRGATVKNILNFEKDYKDAEVIKLEQNYRSTKVILEAAHQVIAKNKARKDKKLWTENEDGESIMVFKAPDEVMEANWVIKKIENLGDSISLNDVAVLYRTNAQSRSLEEAFINNGMPYQIVGGTKFYERKEIKDIISYLRIIYNPKDNKSLERIINVPRRGIGPKSLTEMADLARANAKSFAELLSDEQIDLNPKLREFGKLLKDFIVQSEVLNLVDLINYILEKTGYIKMLDDGTLENESRIENIKELITASSKFMDLDPKEALEEFMNEVSLLEGVSEEGSASDDKVTLMTIHAAKGLEFDHVFVVGMEENLFPHSNSIFDETELEEERRLAYVAITRAKRSLYLTHANSRRYFGQIQNNRISRFIEDISPDLKQLEGTEEESRQFSSSYSFGNYNMHKAGFAVGDRVRHEYFGLGKIIYMDDEIVEVDFGEIYGTKELMLEYAKLFKV